MGRGGWSAVLRAEHRRDVPTCGRVRGPDCEGSEANRPTDRAADQIRTSRQPQDRQRNRYRDFDFNPAARRSGDRMNRRTFITLLASAVAWPLAARAQQGERVRRIGVLQGGSDRDDQRSQPSMAAFLQGLQQSGWTDGRNVRIDYRWPAGDADQARKYAAELVALAPDVILTASSISLAALLQTTRTVPIVFLGIVDPVGSGFVNSLSRPGGNATGFMLFDYDLSAKWLELLKEIAPGVRRAAVLRDSTIPTGIGQFAVIQYVSRPVGVEVSPVEVRAAPEIERGVAAFARSANGGLIVAGSPLSLVHRELIIALAARHKL